MYWQYTTALASLVLTATNPEIKTNAARAVASFVFIVTPPIGRSVDSTLSANPIPAYRKNVPLRSGDDAPLPDRRKRGDELLRLFQFLHDFVQIEAGCLLPLRVVTERGQELAHVILCWHKQEHVIEQPVVVRVRGNVRPLIGIGTEIEDLWNAQASKGIGPEQKLPVGALLHEHYLPVVVSQSDQLLIVVDIEERVSL